MIVVVMIFSAVLAVTIQTALPAWGFLGGAKLPFLMAVVLYYALTRERGMTLAAGALAGVLQDALSFVPMGYSSAVFCGLALFAGLFRDVVMTESPLTAALFGAGGGLLATLASYLLLAHAGQAPAFDLRLAWKLAGSAGAGALVAPVTLATLRGLDRLLGMVPVRRTPIDDEANAYL